MINVSNNAMGVSLPVLFRKILVNPHDNVIFECAFDHLMEQIRRQELMDVSSRKVVCKWLPYADSEHSTE
jgi:hypothetical protein